MLVAPPPPPPLQETAGATRQSNIAQDAMAKPGFQAFFRLRAAKAASTTSNPSHRAGNFQSRPSGFVPGNSNEDAVVVIVRVEEAEPGPGVTLAGEKTHEASDGRPWHVSETGLAKLTSP